jgi:hypothetical protein
VRIDLHRIPLVADLVNDKPFTLRDRILWMLTNKGSKMASYKEGKNSVCPKSYTLEARRMLEVNFLFGLNFG